MSYETITISTEDLAYSLDHVSDRVEETTSAVKDTVAAVCDAEREAADNVCESVSTGFFKLIHSQLMQKKIQTQAAAESQLLTLRHFAQSLQRIKKQMGVDFERISLRYTKLFKTLGDSLQGRIYALDRPLTDVVDKDYGILDRRVLMAGAPSIVAQQDIVSAMSELTTVRCKRDCQKVLEGVKTLIDHGTTLGKTMSGIVREKQHGNIRSICAPVLVMESVDLYLPEGKQVNFMSPETDFNSSIVSKINEKCFETASNFVWGTVESCHKAEVGKRVRQLAAKEGGNKRIMKLVIELLDKSAWKDLEAIE